MRKKRVFLTVLSIFCFLFAASAYALDAPVPVYPKNSGGQVYYSSRLPTFSWTPVVGALTYVLRVWEVGIPSPPVIWQRVAGTSWALSADNELTPGTEYYWKVRGEDASGAGPVSARASFTAGKLKYLSVGAAEFVPASDSYDFNRVNGGTSLRPSVDAIQIWGAPINLPQGAIVDYITLYYNNIAPVSIGTSCELTYNPYDTGVRYAMGDVTAGTGAGYDSVTDLVIADASIDNTENTYLLTVMLWSADNELVHVEIGYWD